MTMKKCVCCGKELKDAFGKTLYCTNCALYVYEMGIKIRTQKVLIKRLKSKLIDLGVKNIKIDKEL